jgi:CRP/FNR family cyclic AMP-dependent transcriptional regulator
VRVATRNYACLRYYAVIGETVALFESLPERERTALEARCRRIKVPAQAYLYHEGQAGDAVYVLVSGRIGIWSGGERGDPVLLAILGPGEMFGEMAILSDERVRTASTQALSAVEVIQILRIDIESLRQRFPRISDVFIAALLRLVQRLTIQVSELSELDGSTRLYRQLWRLGDVYEKRRTGAELPISQQQLASMTGVGLRITNRVLNEARIEGILETGKKRIVINDWVMVRRRAGLRFRAG